jgi:hypothetical protein
MVNNADVSSILLPNVWIKSNENLVDSSDDILMSYTIIFSCTGSLFLLAIVLILLSTLHKQSEPIQHEKYLYADESPRDVHVDMATQCESNPLKPANFPEAFQPELTDPIRPKLKTIRIKRNKLAGSNIAVKLQVNSHAQTQQYESKYDECRQS